MPDNIDITPGSGKTIAADEVDDALFQRIKLTHGADGSATDVSSASPLPVDQQSALPAGTNNIGDVDVDSVAIPSTLHNGQKTVTTAGTAEALASSQTILSGVTVKALADNTDTVYVGDSGVSASNGYELAAGDSVFLEIADLATVFVDAAVDGEGVSFVGS